VSTRFTFDQAPDSAPVWSPDGSRIAFAAYRAGGNGIYQKTTNGAGKEQVLVSVTGDEKLPDDWSRDGRFLLYTQQDPQTHADLWVLPLTSDGTPSGTATPFANTAFSEEQGRFSPDTRWIAYASDESGRSEIYIQPFPAPPNGGSKTPISRDGGSQPRWRLDGKELFYSSPDGKLMAVDVTEDPIFKASAPRNLVPSTRSSDRPQSRRRPGSRLGRGSRWQAAPYRHRDNIVRIHHGSAELDCGSEKGIASQQQQDLVCTGMQG
jgi:Tol biopolymer transport system component